MSDYDVRLWRALHRVLLVLALGTVVLLIGLGGGAQRADSLFGVLLLVLAISPVALAVRGMPPHARAKLPELPKRRLLLTITAALLACSAAFLAFWILVNLVAPGVLAPLSLAVPVLAGAGLTTLAGRFTRTRRR